MSIPEQEWDEGQQDLMLALHAFEASLCPNCGRPMEECTAAANEGKYRVDPPTRCHATTAIASASKAYADSPAAEALMFAARIPS